MMMEALRTSIEPCGIRPPSTKTVVTSGRARSSLTMSSVTFSVSDRREPGGNSIDKSERAVSCAGRKPDASSTMLPTDAARISRPTPMVAK